MKLINSDGSWNPYLAGAIVGVLAIASVLVTTKMLGKTKYLGASTSFVRAAGLVEQKITPEKTALNEYYTKTKIKVDWQMMVVLGILIGAAISSLGDKSFKLEAIPPIWRERFGTSIIKRAGGAFFGGVIAIIGVRMANGCPSGHGLSGLMQLAVSGFVAMVLFFAAGIATAKIIYGGKK